MTKTRIILFLISAALIAVIYSLPRMVVENEKDDNVTLSERLETNEPHVEGTSEISQSLREEINSLKDSFTSSTIKEKRVIFADSLARSLKNAFLYDSAAFYLGEVAEEVQSEERYKKAADAYYDAFNFAVSKEKQVYLGEKARGLYEKVLEINPANNNAKANLALTYVTSESPMRGIAMLREILEEEPNHEQALLNLGLLSITSGQLDRAIERFETLKAAHPENYQARLYLGYCLLETGQNNKAKQEFEFVLSSDAEESLKSAATQYLESIN